VVVGRLLFVQKPRDLSKILRIERRRSRSKNLIEIGPGGGELSLTPVTLHGKKKIGCVRIEDVQPHEPRLDTDPTLG
jgi:16S rRNA A1518/A1519 N6-dimethyltransferase RsmA/KsgA/DIM1 with predicted DNA glycosylase/AP lyase activity